MPDDERIDIAEEQIAGFGLFARARDIFEQPADLQTAEVSGDGQSGLVAETAGPAAAGKFGNGIADAHILPYQGVVRGAAGFAVPEHGGFALVGNADGRQVVRRNAGLFHAFGYDLLRAKPDFSGVVLDPAWLRIDLLMLFLSAGGDAPSAVEYDEAGAGGTLVDGSDVIRHGLPVYSVARGLVCHHREYGRNYQPADFCGVRTVAG